MITLMKHTAFALFLLPALALSSLAEAAVDPGAQALVDGAMLKALGVKDAATDGDVVRATVGSNPIYLTNKTASKSWVAVFPVPANAQGLADIATAVGGDVSTPILVIGLSKDTMDPAAIPQVGALAALAMNGVVSWDSGANLIAKITAATAGPLAELENAGIFPSGGAVVSGTLGASLVEKLGGGAREPVLADWSITLGAKTGRWAPADVPLTAEAVSLTFRRDQKAAQNTATAIGGDVKQLSVSWPGATTPAIDTTLVVKRIGATGIEISAAISSLPNSPASPLNVTTLGFSYKKGDAGGRAELGLLAGFQVRVEGNPAFVAMAKAGSDGALAIVGTLSSDWRQPFGADDLTILAGTSIDFSLSAKGDLGFGFTGNVKVGAAQYGGALCANVTPAVPPVVKAVGLKFATNQPIKPADAMARLAELTDLARKADPTTQTVLPGAKTFDVPLPEIANPEVLLYTKGLSCAQEAFKGRTGFGALVKGDATFLQKPVGSVDNWFQVGGGKTDGFSIDNRISAFALPNDVVKLSGATLIAAAPLSTKEPARLAETRVAVKGSATIAGSAQTLEITFDASTARFTLRSAVGPLGQVDLQAVSVGPSLVQMNDFTLTATVESGSAADKAVRSAIASMLTDAATTRKNANKAAVDAIAGAQRRYDSASARLESVASEAVRTCLNNGPEACFELSLSQLANDEERRVYADWVKAATDLELAKASNGAQAAAFKAWEEIDKSVKAAAGASGALKVDGITLAGSLESASMTMRANVSIAGQKSSPSFTVALGSGGTLGKDDEKKNFFDNLERNSPKPPIAVPFQRGASTKTTLTLEWETENAKKKPVLTAMVVAASGIDAKCGGAAVKPSGVAFLYGRRPGQPKVDPLTSEPVKPLYIGYAQLGKAGSCNEGMAKFNHSTAPDDNNTNCSNRFVGLRELADLDATYVFSVLYRGGPTACSVNDPDPASDKNGYRASLSDEIEIQLGPANLRADDAGAIHPIAPTTLETYQGSAWSETKTCPANTWVTQLRQRVEKKQGADEDDTALNAIELVCTDVRGAGRVEIKAHDGYWGDWGNWSPACPAGTFVNAGRIRVEGQENVKDATGANDVELRCSGGQVLSAGNGLDWGKWSCTEYTWKNGVGTCPDANKFHTCPAGMAVCGVSVNVMPRYGKSFDDTAMNGVKLRCCSTAP